MNEGETRSILDDLFVRQAADLVMTCGNCGHEASHRLPEIVDWRDREPDGGGGVGGAAAS